MTYLITMTTDFGLQDYYVPVIKGAIISQNPQANIIDISHNIKNYDIVQAAFVLKNAYADFPEGSIHLITVNNAESGIERFLVSLYNGHYFICPDNGLLTLMFGIIPQQVYLLDFPRSGTFPIKEIFSNAINHILSEKSFEEIGSPIEDIVQRISLQPVISPKQIRGSIIHIDNFDNAIVNITKEIFERYHHGRTFSVTFKRHDAINKIHAHYGDVAIGETLCLFNSAGYLEIAINMGMAAEMLGLRLEDLVQIDFE